MGNWGQMYLKQRKGFRIGTTFEVIPKGTKLRFVSLVFVQEPNCPFYILSLFDQKHNRTLEIDFDVSYTSILKGNIPYLKRYKKK